MARRYHRVAVACGNRWRSPVVHDRFTVEQRRTVTRSKDFPAHIHPDQGVTQPMARRPTLAFLAVLAAAGVLAVGVQVASAGSDHHSRSGRSGHAWRSWAGGGGYAPTATPIKHLVVIFQENVSFDHYFGTYPTAENNPGETPFEPRKKNKPKGVNTLLTPLDVNNK